MFAFCCFGSKFHDARKRWHWLRPVLVSSGHMLAIPTPPPPTPLPPCSCSRHTASDIRRKRAQALQTSHGGKSRARNAILAKTLQCTSHSGGNRLPSATAARRITNIHRAKAAAASLFFEKSIPVVFFALSSRSNECAVLDTLPSSSAPLLASLGSSPAAAASYRAVTIL